MKSVTSKLSVLLLAAGLLANPAKAFTIANQTSDVTIQAHESSGQSFDRGFNKTIGPNSAESCNWKDKGCNSDGSQTAAIGMSVGILKINPATGYNYRCGIVDAHGNTEVFMEAGGDITVNNENGQYVEHVYNADGIQTYVPIICQ